MLEKAFRKQSGGECRTVIYLDLLFWENLMMDSYLLLFTGLFLRQPTTCLRIFMAGTVGSLYSCIYTWFMVWARSNFDPREIWAGSVPMILCAVISYVLICVLMLYLAFGMHDKHSVMKNMAVFYGTAVFTGGILQSLKNFFTMNHRLFFTKGNETYLPQWTMMPGAWLLFGAGIVLSFCAGTAILRVCFGHHRGEAGIYRLRLEFENKYVNVKALLDTGNRMYDPVDFRPVTVVESSVLEDILGNLHDKKTRAVPYCSLGNDHGMIYAVKADRIMICRKKDVWQYEDAYIGIYPGVLCKNGAYQGILHPDMIQFGHKL